MKRRAVRQRNHASSRFVMAYRQVTVFLLMVCILVIAMLVYAQSGSWSIFGHKGSDIEPPLEATTLQGLTAADLLDSISRVPSGIALPVCSAAVRGKKFLLEAASSAGSSDVLYLCMKKADGSYGWVNK